MDSNPFKSDRDVAMIPNYVHEKQCDRYMTIIKWLVIVIVILIVSLVGYVIYNSQMETVSYTQEAEANWNSSVNIDGSGEMNVYGGESQADNNSQKEETEGSKGNAN